MASQLFANNAVSTVSGSLAQSGTTVTLAAATGADFPSPTGGDYFLVTLYQKDISSNEYRLEVVKVTGRTADTLTIERDYESMTGNVGGYSYPENPGETVYVELRWTAAGAANGMQKSANLADVASASTSRTNLGLGDSATKNVGTGATNVAAGDHAHTGVYEPANANIQSHIGSTSNPHGVTAAQTGGIPATEKGAANGVATLGADSKIPSGQLPAIAITSTYVVASQVAQLALTAQEGDVAVRSDLSKSYIHNGGVSATMADWTELIAPTTGSITSSGFTMNTARVLGRTTASTGVIEELTTVPVSLGGTGVATLTGIVKGSGTSAFVAATVRTDYAEPTTALATGILKNTTTTGAHSIATAGTDYAKGDTATSWTANQTYNNSTVLLKGSSTGYHTFTSANAGASNYVLNVPAATTYIPIVTQQLTISGPSAARTYTLPDSNSTLIASGDALGTPSSGTLSGCSALPPAGVTFAADVRLLGRSAGSAGAGQEITVGSGLTLSGGSLSASSSGITMGKAIAAAIVFG